MSHIHPTQLRALLLLSLAPTSWMPAIVFIILFLISGCSVSIQEQYRISYLSTDHKGVTNLWQAYPNGNDKGLLFPWLGLTREFSWLPDGSNLYVWMLESSPKSKNYIFGDLIKGPGPCITCGVYEYWLEPIPSSKDDLVLITAKTDGYIEFYIIKKDGK